MKQTRGLILACGLVVMLLATVASAGPTYRIYGTREGLVGNRTANGHTIVSYDRFCALPSGKSLDCNGCRSKTVTITNPANGKTASNVPVWDVGPWNTKDDYWNSPREYFSGIALGVPEAQAAYQNGYNGGKDMYGRVVSNPAGIDLADGTFWTDLGMSNNGWLNVTFNFVANPPPTGTSIIIDNTNGGFTASANWSTGTSATDKYGTNYRYRSTAAISDMASWKFTPSASGTWVLSAWWSAGTNRSATAPFKLTDGATATVNQQANGGKWNTLGSKSLTSGVQYTVSLSCWTTSGYIVLADAVKAQKQ